MATSSSTGHPAGFGKSSINARHCVLGSLAASWLAEADKLDEAIDMWEQHSD
jgi:hypothetical protein